jgi:hypothetical protein
MNRDQAGRRPGGTIFVVENRMSKMVLLADPAGRDDISPATHATLRNRFAISIKLEHDPEKWRPVFRNDHAQTKG